MFYLKSYNKVMPRSRTKDIRWIINPLMNYCFKELAADLREKVVSSDFVGWILSSLFVVHFFTACNTVWSFEGLLDNNLMSFAYTNTLTSFTATSLLMRFSMTIKKRRGLRTQHWEIPLVTWLEVDKDLFRWVCCIHMMSQEVLLL